MSLLRRALVVSLLAAALAAGAPSAARAQSCGDIDGVGGITVIDAANIARAAVGLPSACTAAPTLCDLDGSGTITVIDAANAARLAVGLPGLLNCPGGIGQQIEPLIEQVQGALGLGFGFIPGFGGEAQTQPCDSGDFVEGENSITFRSCRSGQLLLDGIVQVSGDEVSFDLTITLLDSNTSITIAGQLVITFPDALVVADPQFGGAFVNGFITFTSSDFGSFQITFVNVSLQLTQFQLPIFGRIVFQANLPGIDSIEQVFDGQNPVQVIVFLANGTVENFVFDPATKMIRPAPEQSICSSCATGPGQFCEVQPECMADVTSTCSCLQTVTGGCFCHEFSLCSALSSCSSDAQCPTNWRCARSCCPDGDNFAGQSFCHPPCGTDAGAFFTLGETGATSGPPE